MAFMDWFFGRNKEEQIKYDLLSPSPFYRSLGKTFATNLLEHPAFLKVVAIQCDLFSLGEFYVEDKYGEPISDDPFLKLIKNPNPYDEKGDLLWMYMFNLMLGNAYLTATSKLVDSNNNRIYSLDSWKVEIPNELERRHDHIIESKSTANELSDQEIIYHYDSGGFKKIKWSNILHVPDLAVGARYKGASRIESLKKIIANSEASLDSENINIRYSGKFMVAGKNSLEDISSMPMGQDEKEDIEDKVNKGNNPVTAVKSLIDIKRFVDNYAHLELDKRYLNAYYLIGKVYGIPRDVLEAYDASTFENQEKARGAHVVYTLQPKGNSLCHGFESLFGYEDRNIKISWDHLPFMQVFEEQRQKAKENKVNTFQKLVLMGVPIDEINSFLGTEFSDVQPKITRRNEQD